MSQDPGDETGMGLERDEVLKDIRRVFGRDVHELVTAQLDVQPPSRVPVEVEVDGVLSTRAIGPLSQDGPPSDNGPPPAGQMVELLLSGVRRAAAALENDVTRGGEAAGAGLVRFRRATGHVAVNLVVIATYVFTVLVVFLVQLTVVGVLFRTSTDSVATLGDLWGHAVGSVQISAGWLGSTWVGRGLLSLAALAGFGGVAGRRMWRRRTQRRTGADGGGDQAT